jgi:hypothetical protein
MSFNTITILIGWIFALAIFCGFIILLRYIDHRERMALIAHGINPDGPNIKPRNRGLLRAGLITMMVGITLTIGLYPVGFILPTSFTTAPLHLGPWLLPGLIPFGVGMALIVSYYLETNHIRDLPEEADNKIIPLKERLERDQNDS